MKKSNLLAAVALVPLSFGFAHAQDTQVEEPAQEEMPAETAPESEAPMTDEAPVEEETMEMEEEAPMEEEEPMADEEPMTDEAAEEPTVAVNDEVLAQQQGPNELRGDWIIGASVTSPDDETVGSIVDVILDPEQGDVTAAILSVGGFLGIGAKDIAVNWDQLEIDYDGQEITIALTRAEADAAPEYEFREQEELPAPPMATDGMGTGTAPAANP